VPTVDVASSALPTMVSYIRDQADVVSVPVDSVLPFAHTAVRVTCHVFQVGGAVVEVAVGGAVVDVAVGGAVVEVAVGGAVVDVAVGGAVVEVAVGGAVVAVAGAVVGHMHVDSVLQALSLHAPEKQVPDAHWVGPLQVVLHAPTGVQQYPPEHAAVSNVVYPQACPIIMLVASVQIFGGLVQTGAGQFKSGPWILEPSPAAFLPCTHDW